MFVLRSAFWLTAAFIVIAPTAGADIGEMGRKAGNDIARESSAIVSAGLTAADCRTLECEVGRAAVSGFLNASTQSSIIPMQDAPLAGPAPVPPPRPDWAN